MELNLKDKVIVVTGGAKGIGEAICLSLRKEGAIPVIIDKDEKSAVSFVAKMDLGNREYQPIIEDLALPENCKRAIEQVKKQFNHVDGLVNNAGVNDGVGLEKGTPDKFLQSLHKNLVQVYCTTHYLLPDLIKSKGPIVNIASKTAVTGQGGTSGYIASKGGILGLTREWAVELLKYQIRVNAVIPAEVYTPLYEQYLGTFPDPAKARKEIESKIPLEKRMTLPSEIADTVVFLLSERASHTTGQWIFPDGGYTHLDRAIT